MARPSPGMVIGVYLQEQGQASVAEMRRAYKEAMKDEDLRRKQMGRTARGSMTYSSFRTYVTKAKALGLIEQVGERPLEHSQKALPSGQRLYSLTAKGQSALSDVWMHLQAHYNKNSLTPL